MSASPGFWNRIANFYSKRPISDEETYRKKLEKSRQHFRPDMDVLEFGCGTGGTALLHAPHVRSIRAIDFSPRMIEIARSKQVETGQENVSFEVGTIQELDCPEGSFGAVLGLSILHLLDDRAEVLAKVYAMLEPGGVFISSSTCLAETASFLRYIAPAGRALGLLPAISFFTERELVDEITAAGFAIEEHWNPGPGKAVFIVARK